MPYVEVVKSDNPKSLCFQTNIWSPGCVVLTVSVALAMISGFGGYLAIRMYVNYVFYPCVAVFLLSTIVTIAFYCCLFRVELVNERKYIITSYRIPYWEGKWFRRRDLVLSCYKYDRFVRVVVDKTTERTTTDRAPCHRLRILDAENKSLVLAMDDYYELVSFVKMGKRMAEHMGIPFEDLSSAGYQPRYLDETIPDSTGVAAQKLVKAIQTPETQKN